MKPTAESRQPKICLHVCCKNGLRQGDVLLLLLFKSALECAIRKVQADQEGLKLVGTHHLLFYNNPNVLGASMLIINENTQASIFISNEISLELNDKKTKYMVMSPRPACSAKSQHVRVQR